MESEKKTNRGSIIIIVILSILIIGLVGYIGYDKLLSNNSTSTIKEKQKNKVTITKENENSAEKEDSKNNTEIDIKETTKVKCYGTYYVNGDANQGIYTLKEEGTYQVENEETTGVFTINENTITFIEMKHTTGPREEDPIYYNPKSYLISDDCSTIRLTESGSHTSAYLKKVN